MTHLPDHERGLRSSKLLLEFKINFLKLSIIIIMNFFRQIKQTFRRDTLSSLDISAILGDRAITFAIAEKSCAVHKQLIYLVCPEGRSFKLFFLFFSERHGICIEPDLAITCGPYLSYFGFQPWNMRLTEIM